MDGTSFCSIRKLGAELGAFSMVSVSWLPLWVGVGLVSAISHYKLREANGAVDVSASVYGNKGARRGVRQNSATVIVAQDIADHRAYGGRDGVPRRLPSQQFLDKFVPIHVLVNVVAGTGRGLCADGMKVVRFEIGDETGTLVLREVINDSFAGFGCIEKCSY